MTRTDKEALEAIRDFPVNGNSEPEQMELGIEAMQAIAAAQLSGEDWGILVPREPAAPTLEEYRAMVKVNTCKWCNNALAQQVEAYEHKGGWLVAGMEGRQWLSIHCNQVNARTGARCNYDWSLNKLGVER